MLFPQPFLQSPRTEKSPCARELARALPFLVPGSTFMEPNATSGSEPCDLNRGTLLPTLTGGYRGEHLIAIRVEEELLRRGLQLLRMMLNEGRHRAEVR